ncbi:MAG: hypothetical protein JRH20_15725 [Deltaproteobacteria bacterium]|nr:hypothetical protein [Deltaproteobacteria bacterium]
MKLDKVLPAQLQDQSATVFKTLKTIDPRPTSIWVKALEQHISRAKGKEREALTLVKEQLVHTDIPQLDTKTDARISLREMADKVYRHYRRSSYRNLPKSLPDFSAMPAGLTVEGHLRHSGAKRLAFLEQKLAQWRGSEKKEDQQQAKRLRRYLVHYKDKNQWGEKWLDQRLNAFSKQRPTGKGLVGVLDASALDPEQRQAMEKIVGEAWQKITGIIHPELLKRVGLPRIVVNPKQLGAAYLPAKMTIELSPYSNVSAVMHEFGHFLCYRGGLRIFAVAHVLRAERAALKGNLIDLLQGPAWKGWFFRQYIGREYPGDGATEVLSVGLEHLGSSKEALRVFKADGDFLLRMLAVLQQKPFQRKK